MTYQFQEVTGFEWDEGNKDKNFLGHKVSNGECEQLFFNEPLIIIDDVKHSGREQRHAALGRTDDDRRLLIIFTMRGRLIRVISARDMNRKERNYYEHNG